MKRTVVKIITTKKIRERPNVLPSDITPHTLTHQLHGDESLRETKSSREEDTREKEGGREEGTKGWQWNDGGSDIQSQLIPSG